MAVPEVFDAIERSGLSTWLRESDSLFGFYFILLFHTFGLSLLVGGNMLVDLRILGVATELPLKSFQWLFKVMWTGFGINATTGVLLLSAYPTKALTNFVFYSKLSMIAIAIIIMQRIKTKVFDDTSLSETAMMARGKVLAMWSLVLWTGAITAGRLLAYTYTYITYGRRG
jgi:hypothetical protein